MNKEIELIAYEGKHFTIEWYFNEQQKSPALEYYKNLNQDARIQALKLFKRMGDVGKIMDKTKFTYEGNKIYAFKPKPNRFLCFFFEEKKIIVTNAFCKKQQKLPSGERERAIKYREAYLYRKKGGYHA